MALHLNEKGGVLAEWLVSSTLILMSLSLGLHLLMSLYQGQKALSLSSTLAIQSPLASQMIRASLRGLKQAQAWGQVDRHPTKGLVLTLGFEARPEWGLKDCVGYSGTKGEILIQQYWVDKSTLYCLSASSPVSQPLMQELLSFDVILWKKTDQGAVIAAVGEKVSGQDLWRIEWGWKSLERWHHWVHSMG